MPTNNTPGVYIEEIPKYPSSIAEMETSIPAFIGYTEKAQKISSNDLILKPTKIASLTEFEQVFGGPKDEAIEITINDKPNGGYTVSSFIKPLKGYLLYYSMRLFFENGGGPCFIVSTGIFQATPVIDLSGDGGSNTETLDGLLDGLDAIKKEDQITLVVIPEAIDLLDTEYSTLVQAVLHQCYKLKDRFAIFDIHGGDRDLDTTEIRTVRGYYGNKYLNYGAAYYPYIKTTLNYYVNKQETNVSVIHNESINSLGSLKQSNSTLYHFTKSQLKKYFVKLPPSAAIAGVYATIDRERGVWKSPANVSLASVIEPVNNISNEMQKTLNVDYESGKSINAIRAFPGRGTVVWGARTLAGNDNEWRYVSVHRFCSIVKESIKKSTAWAVFEPNDANTWVKLRSMIENYLMQKFREGAMFGTAPDKAFFVHCGLGTTMTQQDILEGRLSIIIGLALNRPAEYIILKVDQKIRSS